MIPLLLVGNLPFLAVALFVAGPSIAPTMITTALVELHVPRAKPTEGITWTSAGLAAGTGAVAVAVAVGCLGYRRLSRPVPQRGGTHEQHSQQEEPHLA
jgi:hypothetical protein